MPRILHIIDSLGRGGLAKQLLVLGQGLVERGFDVHVAALADRGAMRGEFASAGMTAEELGRQWRIDPLVYLKLLRLMRRVRPDIVHTWGGAASLYGQSAASSHGVQRIVAGHYRIEPWNSGAAWLLERRLARFAARLATNSPLIRNWCAARGLPADRFSVIPFGIAPARPSDVSREQLLRELQLPADARLIGVVGRLVPEKRVKDLIWAADLLRVLHDNLRLLVIGDGPLRPQLEQYARMASDLEHIQFLGERADAWRITPHLDVLWNADEPRDHSISILEAMAAGVPVIASDTPLNRELVAENETGYLVPLYARSGRADRARHTDHIFNDHEIATRLQRAAQLRADQHFSAEGLIQRHIDLYA